jgi:hypothetical protein
MELIAFILIEKPYVILYYKYNSENLICTIIHRAKQEICEAVNVGNPVRGIVEHKKRCPHL